jgi:ketosteroid isomerase-like protein
MSPTRDPSVAAANETLIRDYISHLSNREIDQLSAFYTTDGQYWVNEDRSRMPFSGDIPLAQRLAGLKDFVNIFTTWSLEITSIVSNDDKVMMEGNARGEGPGEILYRQTVVMTFDISDGKIKKKREYIDLQETAALFSTLQQIASVS